MVTMRTSFYNLSPNLKLVLRVKFLAERDDFLLHQCCDFIKWADRGVLFTVANFTPPLKLFSLAAIDIEA